MVKFSDDISGQYASYLDDESGIAENTSASRIWFPTSHDEVVSVMKNSIEEKIPVTVSGGGTGISGGRAPTKGWIIATDEMISVEDSPKEWQDPETGKQYGVSFEKIEESDTITVPVGMTLRSIQRCVSEQNLFYPPDPTERSSYIGGNVSTNASGARSFKFGSTRRWVDSIRVVLANGETAVLSRKDPQVDDGHLSFTTKEGTVYRIPLPEFDLPEVTKHVAGPVLNNKSQPMDIFIGSNGIFGIITEVTLRLLPSPTNIISMFVHCNSFEDAISLIQKCQRLREFRESPIPMSVEYLDNAAVKIMQQKDSKIPDSVAIVLLEQDVYSDAEEEQILEDWHKIFEELGIRNISVALNHRENEHHKFLRHWVPEWLIQTTKSYGFPIYVSDTSVPADKFKEFIFYLHDVAFRFKQVTDPTDEIYDLCSVLIGHVGDSHPHLAMIPTNKKQAQLAQELMTELIEKSVELGGSMASEHGLGKKEFNGQPAIVKQYGQNGIEEVRKLKTLMDPEYRLCPNNIIPTPY